MKRLLFFLLLVPCSLLKSQDIEGAKDYSLFPRIKGFNLYDYSVQNFAAYRFCDEDGSNIQVEGMVSYYYYECDCDIDPQRIIKTFGDIVTGLGGKIYGDDPNQKWMVVHTNNRQIWVDLFAEDFYYTLNIIEKGELISEVTPGSLLEDLASKGRAIIYLNFDRDMCLIKDECKPVIGMIADALKTQPELKILIEGHTDNIGRSEDNLLLSGNRATAIANALIEAGIDAGRIETRGIGEESPVASNETVEGRALNSRIEIIKK